MNCCLYNYSLLLVVERIRLYNNCSLLNTERMITATSIEWGTVKVDGLCNKGELFGEPWLIMVANGCYRSFFLIAFECVDYPIKSPTDFCLSGFLLFTFSIGLAHRLVRH